MQALADHAAFTSNTHGPVATSTMPVTARPVVTVRLAVAPRAGTPLLDHATEMRRFRALRTLGLDAIYPRISSRFLVMDAGAGDIIPKAGPVQVAAASARHPQPAVRCTADLQRLEQDLLALASKPANGQAGAPALLLDYLSACDDRAAARLLAMPALRPLLTRHNHHGEAVLHVAVQRKMPVAIERLLDMAPDPAALIRAESCLGVNALFLACMRGDVEFVRALLRHPAAVALAVVVPPRRWNALMAVAMDGHVSIAAMLLATATGAAQALARDGQGQNALMYAAMQGQTSVAELLLAHPSAQGQAKALDEKGHNALMLAVAGNRRSLVRLLLTHPASAGQVIEVAADGDDALIIAVRHGHREIIAMLLADPLAEILLDGATCGGVSALMLAALRGDAALLAVLLAAMSAEQANACDANGCNALMLAARHGHAEVVCLLLADTRTAPQVFKSDLRGHNALVHATLAGSVAAVEALLGDLSGLAQAVAISQHTFNAMVVEVLKDGVESLFALAGVPLAEPGGAGVTGKKRYTLKEVASYCPPRVVMTLLPIIARKIVEKRAH